MAEAKTGTGDSDLSMEEILQSIRKIIAEDGDEAKPTASAAPAEPQDVAGSDVLELTDMVEEAPAPVMAAPEPAAAAPATNGNGSHTDILSTIDNAITTEPAKPVTTTAAPAAALAPAMSQEYIDTLISKEAASAASSAFKKLQTPEPPLNLTPSPVFASGNTVEAMVMESLKPMIKQWLDANLPKIVERVVEREVKKIAK